MTLSVNNPYMQILFVNGAVFYAADDGQECGKSVLLGRALPEVPDPSRFGSKYKAVCRTVQSDSDSMRRYRSYGHYIMDITDILDIMDVTDITNITDVTDTFWTSWTLRTLR